MRYERTRLSESMTYCDQKIGRNHTNFQSSDTVNVHDKNNSREVIDG
jgi:hypothetical protein